MSEHQATIDILADILQAQRLTHDAVTRLAEAIAGAGRNSPAGQAAAIAKTVIADAATPSVDELFPKGKPQPGSEAAIDTPPEPAAATGVTYADISKAVTELVKTDKPKVMAAFVKCGVKRGPELKPEQYAQFMELLA